MFEDSENRLSSEVLPTGRPVPTGRELELGTLRFALSVKRLYEKIQIESGPGRQILQHIFESSDTASDLIQKATAQRNPAKAQKLYTEVLQHIHKIVHWLNQMENGGEVKLEMVRPILDAGSALALELAAVSSPQPKHSATNLGEKDLSDI